MNGSQDVIHHPVTGRDDARRPQSERAIELRPGEVDDRDIDPAERQQGGENEGADGTRADQDDSIAGLRP